MKKKKRCSMWFGGWLVCILFLTAASLGHAEVPKSSGGSLAIEQYMLNQGTGWMFGTTTDVRIASIGEGIVGIGTASNPEPPVYVLYQGYLHVRLYDPPLIDYQYDIREIFALEFSPDGETIVEKTWQSDPDPFFTWTLKADVPVSGYSLAFDDFPDEFIDVADPFFQTPELYLTDGMHVFYVIAKTDGGTFGAPGMFEIWVDSARPEISNPTPLNGAVVNDPRPAIQAVVFDALSGVDPDTVTFTVSHELDNFSVLANFDPTTGLALYIPDADFPDGIVTVRLEARDFAGNEAVPIFWSFTVATEAPQGWVLINDDQPVTEVPDVTLTFSAIDLFANVTEMIVSEDGVFDSEEWEPYLPTGEKAWSFEPLAGTHTIYVKFKDEGGTISDVFSDSILLVLTLPDTFISSSPQTLTLETDATFAFTATDPQSLFQYKVDNEEWTAFSVETTATLGGLAQGNHYFQVRAGIDLDGSGEIEADEMDVSPAVMSWTIGNITEVPLDASQPIRYYKQE